MTTCNECHWFRRPQTPGGEATAGECRRFPPTSRVGGPAQYPQLPENTPSCGEFLRLLSDNG